MDYGLLPPEINSARMYAGPGPGSMLAAASAWDQLATELGSAAVSYSSAIAGLTGGAWSGPSSAAMATAAAPYVTWLHTTAAQAEQTANQARAAAGAYETAFAMTVPPPVIAANRAQLMTLIATNVLGQNAPAIAATEAQYGEMWAQDAAAMYGYAGSSAAASQVTPFGSPPQTTNSAAQGSQAAAVQAGTGTATGTDTQAMLSQVTTTAPQALQSLSAPSTSSTSSSTSALSTAMNELKSYLYPMSIMSMMPMRALSMINMTKSLSTVSAVGGKAITAAAAPAVAAVAPALTGGLASSTGALGSAAGLGAGGAAATAGLGQAMSIGPLSVPHGWSAAAVPAFSPIATGFPGGAAAPAINPVDVAGGGIGGAPSTGSAGMPLIANMAGRGVGGVTPSYDMRPSVVPRTPSAG